MEEINNKQYLKSLIEGTFFNLIQAYILKAGFPIFTSVPTYTGFQGETVLVDDESATRQICSFLNGTWKCADLNAVLSAAKGVLLTANQTLADGTWTAISFNGERWDTNSEFDTANGKFTAKKSGYYAVSAGAEFASSAVGNRILAVYVSGARKAMNTMPLNSAAGNSALCVSDIVYLGIGDTIEIYAIQNSGGNLDLIFCSDADKTFVSIYKL